MKRNWRKLLSLVLSVMVILTTAGTPVMAAEKKAAPTTVTNCEASGFWTEVLSLGFEDTAWMDKINSVTVNEIQYTKGTINPLEVIQICGKLGMRPEHLEVIKL